MAQNIYDTREFFAAYSRLDRSIHGLDGAPEWKAIQALLPNLEGKRIADLGCGFGWFARWAREHGAARVVGFDLSKNMIARARADTNDPSIEYVIADLENLDLPEACFDFTYSSLAFHYIADFDRLISTVRRALVPGSHFTFTMEHPVYMAPAHPGWLVDRQGHKAWPVNGYFTEGRRTTDWLAKGVVKYHRTMGTTLNSLIRAGFNIQHVQEWCPASDQVAADPRLEEELERPMILIVSARRLS